MYEILDRKVILSSVGIWSLSQFPGVKRGEGVGFRG